MQSNPFGVLGGFATFTHAGSVPLSLRDFFGLCAASDPCSNTPKPLNEWLSDQPDLLLDARDYHNQEPEWQGIDPDKTPVFYRTQDDVKKIRKSSSERGGHHPHVLALGGPTGQDLTITGEKGKCKNDCHTKATNFQMRLLRSIKCKLGI